MWFFSLLPALAALVTVVAGVALPRNGGDCASTEAGCDVAQLCVSFEPPKDTIRHRGVIAVRRQSDNFILGYVSSSSLVNGKYWYNELVFALVVHVDLPKNGPNDQLNLCAENPSSGFPLVGLVQGRDDPDTNLAAGSFRYTYLAGTAPTPPGSPALLVPNSYIGPPGLLPRSAESAIWSFDPVTKVLLPRWINTDKNSLAIEVFVQNAGPFIRNTGIYVGGDGQAFANQYLAGVPVDLVDLVLVI